MDLPKGGSKIKDLMSECERKVVWWLEDLSKNFEHMPNQQKQVPSWFLNVVHDNCFHLFTDIS